MNVSTWIVSALGPRPTHSVGRAFFVTHGMFMGLGLSAVVLSTVPEIIAVHGALLAGLIEASLVFFTLEYAARLYFAPRLKAHGDHLSRYRARMRWITSPAGLIDLLGWLPLLIAFASMDDWLHARLFGVFWVLKLGRHAPRLGLLGRVLRQAREPLISVFFAFLMVLLFAATLAYLVEGPRQPDQFGSVPRALWWAITTLTTTGYGDVVPITPFGRLIAGTVMVCGILVFALWTGILASEFALEVRRHEFLRTWNLVARVPYFQKVGAAVLADVARVLRPREFAEGAVIMRRGDPGDCMYFIVEGEIKIKVQPHPVRLGPGSFVGEMALITGAPRSATVRAMRKSLLLELDIADFREIAARRPELIEAIDREASRRAARAPVETTKAQRKA